MPIPRTFGPKFGTCNICGKPAKLTRDHTPPKGCIRPRAVDLVHIVNSLPAKRQRKMEKRHLQRGVEYRTLCSNCNNNVLGKLNDPAFIEFVNNVSNLLHASMRVLTPPIVTVHGHPQKLMKSILGHIMAQGVGRSDNGDLTSDLREYVLDQAKPLPTFLDMYYWLYPFQDRLLARDMVLLLGNPVSTWLMKFYPVAFLIVFDKKPENRMDHNVLNLAKYRDIPVDIEVDVPVLLSEFPPQGWPEYPASRTATFWGEDAIRTV